MQITFDTHPKSKYWSRLNTIQPSEVALNSHKKFWFDCECGHAFDSTLLNVNQAGNWCPYCYNRKLCGKCETCLSKSFASHPKSVYWSDVNACKPIDVLKGSEKKFYFNCDKCSHLLFMCIKQITCKGHWCSYCSHQKLCDDNNCTICYNNSFASVEKSIFLSDKTINTRKVFKSTNKQYTFDCNKCSQQFTCQLSNITRGIWCPYCVNKTEHKLYNRLVCEYSVQQQFKVNWCKNPKTNKYLRFDFLLNEFNIIIELDGPQHFTQICNWQSPELNQINDLYKMKCANDNGCSVIRILQKDILYDTYDWVQELTYIINKVIAEGKVQNIYMCKNNEYKDFDEKYAF